MKMTEAQLIHWGNVRRHGWFYVVFLRYGLGWGAVLTVISLGAGFFLSLAEHEPVFSYHLTKLIVVTLILSFFLGLAMGGITWVRSESAYEDWKHEPDRNPIDY